MNKYRQYFRSYSSAYDLEISQKFREYFYLICARIRGKEGPERFDSIFKEFREYESKLKQYSGTSLRCSKVFEIGYGARPNRLIAMQSLGVDVSGIDFDRPAVPPTICGFLESYRRNGFERAMKSVVRALVFDRREIQALANVIKKHGGTLSIDPARFMVGDAYNLTLPENSLDLIYSEDVFEHIPIDSLGVITKNMRKWLKPSGLALIRPNIFTGIMGSHLGEWYLHSPDRVIHRSSEPWEHLRKRRFRANCYLNELWRKDYRKMFSRHFDIVEELVEFPNMGRVHYSDDLSSELFEYGEDELFSNRVLFVLKPKVNYSTN